jgi:hypothetical protein
LGMQLVPAVPRMYIHISYSLTRPITIIDHVALYQMSRLDMFLSSKVLGLPPSLSLSLSLYCSEPHLFSLRHKLTRSSQTALEPTQVSLSMSAIKYLLLRQVNTSTLGCLLRERW